MTLLYLLFMTYKLIFKKIFIYYLILTKKEIKYIEISRLYDYGLFVFWFQEFVSINKYVLKKYLFIPFNIFFRYVHCQEKYKIISNFFKIDITSTIPCSSDDVQSVQKYNKIVF